MNMPTSFEGWVDVAERIVRYILLSLSAVAIVALATGDVWIGAGTINQIISRDHIGWLISFATSGVLAALLVIPAYGIWKKWPWWQIALASLPALIPYLFDAYFDMHYADVLIYNVVNVDTGTLIKTDKTILYMFRGLMLSITTLGDPITAIVVSGFGVIKWLLGTRPGTSAAYEPVEPSKQTWAPSPLEILRKQHPAVDPPQELESSV